MVIWNHQCSFEKKRKKQNFLCFVYFYRIMSGTAFPRCCYASLQAQATEETIFVSANNCNLIWVHLIFRVQATGTTPTLATWSTYSFNVFILILVHLFLLYQIQLKQKHSSEGFLTKCCSAVLFFLLLFYVRDRSGCFAFNHSDILFWTITR